jgi:hypothetical protein
MVANACRPAGDNAIRGFRGDSKEGATFTEGDPEVGSAFRRRDGEDSARRFLADAGEVLLADLFLKDWWEWNMEDAGELLEESRMLGALATDPEVGRGLRCRDGEDSVRRFLADAGGGGRVSMADLFLKDGERNRSVCRSVGFLSWRSAALTSTPKDSARRKRWASLLSTFPLISMRATEMVGTFQIMDRPLLRKKSP